VTGFFQILQPDIRGAPVVGGEDHERVVRHPILVERVEQPPDDGIGLHHEVGIGIESASTLPRLVDGQRRVGRGQRRVEKKWLPRSRSFGDERGGAIREGGENRLQAPAGQRRPRNAGLVVPQEPCGQEFAGNADRPIILDEAEGGPVRDIRAEVEVEAPRGRPAFDGL
jgi:hypothetical protein